MICGTLNLLLTTSTTNNNIKICCCLLCCLCYYVVKVYYILLLSFIIILLFFFNNEPCRPVVRKRQSLPCSQCRERRVELGLAHRPVKARLFSALALFFVVKKHVPGTICCHAVGKKGPRLSLNRQADTRRVRCRRKKTPQLGRLFVYQAFNRSLQQ